MAANQYFSITHCRLSQTDGHGPHGEQWITDLENLIRKWTVDPISAYTRIMQGTQKQHRLAQIVGDLLCVVREAEGEKAVLANAISKGRKRHLRVSRSRTFRFVVDGQLEHLVSLGHLAGQLVLLTLALQWDLQAKDPSAFTGISKKLIKWIQDPVGHSPSSGDIAKGISAIAVTTNSTELERLAKAFVDLRTDPLWETMEKQIRGGRHHSVGRGSLAGVDSIPDLPIAGMSMGSSGVTWNVQDTVLGFAVHDPEKYATILTNKAAAAGTSVVTQTLPFHFSELFEAWTEAMDYLLDPNDPPPWTSTATAPPSGRVGVDRPYRFRIKLSAPITQQQTTWLIHFQHEAINRGGFDELIVVRYGQNSASVLKRVLGNLNQGGIVTAKSEELPITGPTPGIHL